MTDKSCDYGACTAPATEKVLRYSGDRLVEVRFVCLAHKEAAK